MCRHTSWKKDTFIPDYLFFSKFILYLIQNNFHVHTSPYNMILKAVSVGLTRFLLKSMVEQPFGRIEQKDF